MAYECHFPGCGKRATRQERKALMPYNPHAGETMHEETVRVFCANHYGEDECPYHTASESDPKVCGRCGIHIDSLRPY